MGFPQPHEENAGMQARIQKLLSVGVQKFREGSKVGLYMKRS
jgi:hypothetical protein